jgi:short-subunit dehydrogenase
MKETVLITGASTGIGLEFAEIFASKNYNLVLVARSADKLNAFANKHQNVVTIVQDLSKPNAAQILFDELKNQKITIDILINNAGFGDFGMFADSDWNKQEQMINLNITCLTQLTHLCLPNMIANKKGKILNVASSAAFQPGPLMSVYYATKAFVLHFSEAIANELADTGITVTALCPGATTSGFQDLANMHESKLVKGKKLPTSKEVAQYGYDVLMKGKIVAIHGIFNYLQANSVRFTPRNLVTKIVRMVQSK